ALRLKSIIVRHLTNRVQRGRERYGRHDEKLAARPPLQRLVGRRPRTSSFLSPPAMRGCPLRSSPLPSFSRPPHQPPPNPSFLPCGSHSLPPLALAAGYRLLA